MSRPKKPNPEVATGPSQPSISVGAVAEFVCAVYQPPLSEEEIMSVDQTRAMNPTGEEPFSRIDCYIKGGRCTLEAYYQYGFGSRRENRIPAFRTYVRRVTVPRLPGRSFDRTGSLIELSLATADQLRQQQLEINKSKRDLPMAGWR